MTLYRLDYMVRVTEKRIGTDVAGHVSFKFKIINKEWISLIDGYVRHERTVTDGFSLAVNTSHFEL